MKKIGILFCLAIAFLLAGCNNKEKETKEVTSLNSTTIYESHLYGSYINICTTYEKDKATLLFNIVLMPFDYKDYGIDYLMAGDYVEISYTGEWNETGVYPTSLVSKPNITKVEVTHGTIIEFVVTENPGGGTSLAPVDSSIIVGEYLSRDTVNEDGTYQDVDTYPIGTHIYGVRKAFETTNEIYAFYSYNPTTK